MILRKLLPAIMLFTSSAVFAQLGFVNNGVQINVDPGAYVNVTTDYINNQTGGTDGNVNLDGTFILAGDITNNSAGPVFTNIETTPDGSTVLSGTNQSIQGSTAIEFENLFIENSTKTLNITNCDIKGVLDLNGIIDLNKNRLILSNSAITAINYQSGSIISETLPANGLGELEWKIGNNTGAFSVPFGTTTSGTNNLNVVFTAATSASPSDGSVVFATYPADAANEPLPDVVFSLDTIKPINLADRYWKLEPVFSSNPDFSLSFKYTDDDVDQTDNPELIEANLKAIRYNDAQNTWTDMKMTGTCDVVNNRLTTGTISGGDFYSYWTLEEFEIKVPNAFTPGDNNGKNDIFMEGYHVKIFNRWDEILFEGDNGWDGTKDGKLISPGTYYYELIIPDIDNSSKVVTGVITYVSK